MLAGEDRKKNMISKYSVRIQIVLYITLGLEEVLPV
jgi:hypothetical protein